MISKADEDEEKEMILMIKEEEEMTPVTKVEGEKSMASILKSLY